MLKYSSLELWLLDTDMRTDCFEALRPRFSIMYLRYGRENFPFQKIYRSARYFDIIHQKIQLLTAKITKHITGTSPESNHLPAILQVT